MARPSFQRCPSNRSMGRGPRSDRQPGIILLWVPYCPQLRHQSQRGHKLAAGRVPRAVTPCSPPAEGGCSAGHGGHLCHCGVNHSSTGYNITVQIAWGHHKQNSSGEMFHLKLQWWGQHCSNTSFSYRSALSADLFWDIHAPFANPWSSPSAAPLQVPLDPFLSLKSSPKLLSLVAEVCAQKTCAHLSAHVWTQTHRHSLFFP